LRGCLGQSFALGVGVLFAGPGLLVYDTVMDGLLFWAGMGVLPFGGLLGLVMGGLGLVGELGAVGVLGAAGVLGVAGVLGAAGAGAFPAGLGLGVVARLLSAFLASMLPMPVLDLNISEECKAVPVYWLAAIVLEILSRRTWVRRWNSSLSGQNAAHE
jgi:hypothetical protein